MINIAPQSAKDPTSCWRRIIRYPELPITRLTIQTAFPHRILNSPTISWFTFCLATTKYAMSAATANIAVPPASTLRSKPAIVISREFIKNVRIVAAKATPVVIGCIRNRISRPSVGAAVRAPGAPITFEREIFLLYGSLLVF